MRQASLDTVAQIEYGTRVTKKKDGGSAYPVYGGGGATFSLDSWNRENCFIVSRFAMSKECVRYVDGKFFLNDSGLTVSTLDEEVLSQRYLDNFLLARSRRIYGLSRGTAQRNLDMPAFRSLRVPLPPLDEQKRIVAKLDQAQSQLDRLASKLDLQICAIGDLGRAALNQQMTMGRMREAPLVPDDLSGSLWAESTMVDWPKVPLSEVCHRIQDGSHFSPTAQHAGRAPGLFPYVTSKNIRNNGLDLAKVTYVDADFHNAIYKTTRPELGDVLLTKDGANTGQVCINTLDEPFSLLSSVCLISVDKSVLMSQFLCFYLQSPVGLKNLTGQMTGAAIKRIVLKAIRGSLIPLPPLDEQKRIVAKLDEVQQELAALRERLDERRSLALSFRDRTLATAFAGAL